MKVRRVIKITTFVLLLYFAHQYILGLVLWNQLHDLVKRVGGDRANYLVARVDVLTARVILSGVRADGWLFTNSLRARKIAIGIRYKDIKAGRKQVKRVKIYHPVFTYDLAKRPAIEVAAESVTNVPAPYLVEEIRIKGGEIVFLDPPMKDFRLTLEEINGTINELTNNVSLVEERSKIELVGRVAGDKDARCLLWGSFNPRFPKAYFHLNLQVESFPLPAFEPYGAKAYFETGQLDYLLHAVCENYRLQTANEAILRNIKIKERKFSFRKLIGLTADHISEHINRKQGGFAVKFKTEDDMRHNLQDVYLRLVLIMAGECQKVIKAQAGSTFKSNLKGILF